MVSTSSTQRLKDKIGSANAITDASGNTVGEARYYPYGETRLTTGTMVTDQLFTGQREQAGLGIYHYGGRFYLPTLGRFLSADTIVPNMMNPQDFNRYSYVRNNPIRYTDPTGHSQCQTQEDCDDMGTTPMGTGGGRSNGGGGGCGTQGQPRCDRGDDEDTTPDPNPSGLPAPCNPPGDLVCQLQQGGYVDSAGETWSQIYDNLVDGIDHYLEGTFHPYSPMSAGNQICGLAQTRGIGCNPNVVDGGIEIVQGIAGLISFINNSPPQLTGTPIFNSPTPSVPAASLTPIPTSTITPQYTDTFIPTITLTSTMTLTVTSSATLPATSTRTSTIPPTSPYITPTYP